MEKRIEEDIQTLTSGFHTSPDSQVHLSPPEICNTIEREREEGDCGLFVHLCSTMTARGSHCVHAPLQHHDRSHRQPLFLEEVTAVVANYGLGRYCLVCKVLLFMFLKGFLCIVLRQSLTVPGWTPTHGHCTQVLREWVCRCHHRYLCQHRFLLRENVSNQKP